MYWHYFQNLTHTSDNGFFLPSINTATRFREHIAISFRQILLRVWSKIQLWCFYEKNNVFSSFRFSQLWQQPLRGRAPRGRGGGGGGWRRPPGPGRQWCQWWQWSRDPPPPAVALHAAQTLQLLLENILKQLQPQATHRQCSHSVAGSQLQHLRQSCQEQMVSQETLGHCSRSSFETLQKCRKHQRYNKSRLRFKGQLIQKSPTCFFMSIPYLEMCILN